MAETPTSAALKTRYPEFTQVPDSLVELLLGEASQLVNDEWDPADRAPAMLAFAAHLLSLEGWPKRTDATAPIPATAGREIIARRVGDVSTQYSQPSASSGMRATPLGDLNVTPYGRRFWQLLKLNVPTITVV